MPDGDALALPRFDHASLDMRIDGRLDESQWAQVPALDVMKVLEPELLVTPRYRTLLRMFYTERGLYVAFDNEQPADTIVRRLSQRDDGRLNRDTVSFTLDTSGDGRYGYWMTLALGDNQIDGTILPERRYSRDWDGAWYGATVQHERGWSAEFFIPWSQMTMPQRSGTRRIGIYASRNVAHLNERWGWPALPRSQARFISELQPLLLEAVNPRQQWSLFPYASVVRDAVVDETGYKTGFDVFWRPSSNFQLTAAVNPDFGNVEADDVVVNLTAFETFFPEKRLFFLEGREVFITTPRAEWSNNPVTLVNTRRIGAPARSPVVADGVSFAARELAKPTELLGALKLTGQSGPLRFGVLGAVEDEVRLRATNGDRYQQQGRDFAVGRLLYEDNHHGAYRALGWISTLVAHPDADAVVHGLDAHYLNATGRWKYDGQLMYSDVTGAGEGVGGLLDVQYTPRRGLRYRANLSYFDDTLNLNGLGFLRRNDATEVRLGLDWLETGRATVRDFEIRPFLRYERNGDGLTTRAEIGSDLRFTLHRLDRIQSRVAFSPSRYDDRNSFGNGAYRLADGGSMTLLYETDTSRPVSVFAETNYRVDGVDGYVWQQKAGVTWRPVDHVNLQLETAHARREGWLLHQQDRDMTAFDAREWQPKLSLDLFLSAHQQFRVAVQWVAIDAQEDSFFVTPQRPGNLIEVGKGEGPSDDFAIGTLNVQLRYRWQIAPLSDLFVVYTRNGVASPERASFGDLFQQAWQEPQGDQLVFKLRYRLGS